jgi:membrane associated rhomboid family serine protease
MQWIDRLEFKWGRYAIPNLVFYLAGLNLLAFLLYAVVNPNYLKWLYLDPELVLKHGQVWRLVTYIFIPSMGGFRNRLINVLFNLLFLVFLGRNLEQQWGSFKLNLFYLLGFIGNTAAAFLAYFIAVRHAGIVATGFLLNYSLLFALARLDPEQMIFLYFVPVKLKWAAWALAAWLSYLFLNGHTGYRVALFAAIANYLLFFGSELFQEARLHSEVAERRDRFRKESLPGGEPLHRCVVCGKTDLSHCDLEFRVGKDGNDYCIEHLPR